MATEIGTAVTISAMTFGIEIDLIQTTGFAAHGDGGGTTYERSTASLPAEGESIWWFTAGDGSKWQIAGGAEHDAAQFGALGGNSIDACPILNAALSCPQVVRLNLGARRHYINGALSLATINIPSGKALVGTNRKDSWIILNPVTLGSQATAVQTVEFLDNDNGLAADFSIDCQRSGLGGTLNDRVSGLTIRSKNANGHGTRVIRVDVYNATGYAHYESADPGRELRNIARYDCRAFNSQVCFESTGNSEVLTVDCHADVHTTTWDGGALIPCEAMYHEYGAIERVERVRCRGIGQAGAGMFPITTDANIKTLIYTDCDIEITNAVPAIAAIGQNGFIIEDLNIYGGRYQSANGGAARFASTTAKAVGVKFVGGALASNGNGNGSGVDVSIGGVVDLHDCNIVGNANPSGAATAYGVLVQGSGIARIFSGKLTAVGPANMMKPYGGAVQIIAPASLTPGVAAVTTALMYRQMKYGQIARSEFYQYQPVTGNKKFWANIDLIQAATARAKVTVQLSLRGPDGDLSFIVDPVTITWNWQSNSRIQIQIGTPHDLTGFSLVYQIIEHP
ncbi:hypothetical protein [Pseudonocardia sp. TMWB2A]|uniref:hypothetical protein n=1 Tax=Pseudonocardia sp. TMWB2A TaxID=687430 RepID=UPI00307D2576